jgi:hypothetical protein
MNAAVKIVCHDSAFFKTYELIVPGGNTAVKGCKKPAFTVKGQKWALIKNKATGVINWCAIPGATARTLHREISTAHSIEVDSVVYLCAAAGGVRTKRNKKNGRKTRRN